MNLMDDNKKGENQDILDLVKEKLCLQKKAREEEEIRRKEVDRQRQEETKRAQMQNLNAAPMFPGAPTNFPTSPRSHIPTPTPPSLPTNPSSSDSQAMETDEQKLYKYLAHLQNLPKNNRTIPCRGYHSSTGCTRDTSCHYIHLPEYIGITIPKDIFYKARGAYIGKNNFLEGELKRVANSMTIDVIAPLYEKMVGFMSIQEIMQHQAGQ